MKIFRNTLMLLVPVLLLVTGCGPKQELDIPSPHRQVTEPLPDPFNPAEPDPPTPPAPDDPDREARLKRIGQLPIVEVYYTEYTKKEFFPTLDDIKCFTICKHLKEAIDC